MYTKKRAGQPARIAIASGVDPLLLGPLKTTVKVITGEDLGLILLRPTARVGPHILPGASMPISGGIGCPAGPA